jgi:nucleotide-binding universal stress UspA family protein
MFSRLLVGLDGSASADHALAAAIELGRRFRSTIVLAAVADISLLEAPLMATGAGLADAPLPQAGVAELADTLAARATALTAAAAAQVRAAGLAAETVQASGLVDVELRRLAEDVEAIVVGRRGEMHAAPGTIGTVTARVIKRSPRPVVVAGERSSQFRTPVVAYDGGTTSTNALALAARYAEAAAVTLDVVHVSNDAAAAGELLARAGAFLSHEGAAFATHHLEGRLIDAIQSHLAATGADLLVVGAHGGRRRGSLAAGSHAEQLIKATTVPVIVIR